MRTRFTLGLLLILACGNLHGAEMRTDGNITATGSIGIGTSDPKKKVHVLWSGTPSLGNSNSIAIFQHSDSSATGGAAINVIANSGATSYVYFGNENNPSMGRIGFDHQNNNTGMYFSTASTGTKMVGVDRIGNLILYGRNISDSTNGEASTNNGALYVTTNSNYDPTNGTGQGAGMYASYLSTHSLLTSHADPRGVDPGAATSFADPTIDLPFSFCHKDLLIGKGQIVDMSKMVSFVERQMKMEMGEKQGRLIYNFDLPESERMSMDKFEELQNKYQVRKALDKLDQMPWIKVELGSDGKIPDEAFEEIPEYQEVESKKEVKKKEIDFSTKRLVEVTKVENVKMKVATGRNLSRLKSSWELREDGLYRKPNLKDVSVESLIEDSPHLPRWILDRIKAGQQTSMDVRTLTDQIRQMLAAKEDVEERQQAVNVNK